MKHEKKRSLKRTLRLRFVLLATLSAALLLGVIVGIVLLRSHDQITKKADYLLELIRTTPDSAEIGDAHYFSVVFSPETHTAAADLSHTAYVREGTALSLGRQALAAGKDRGFLDGYRFCVTRKADGIQVLLLSRKLPLETFKDTERLLICVSLAGLGLTTVLLALLSGKIVAPLVKANEQQQRFITSASHALKTPVAVISGDTQLLQMELPENEWLSDIAQQTKRLTEMTQALVTLSRYDEGIPQGSLIEFPISDVADEVAASFRSLAASRSLQFKVCITPDCSYRGDEKALREVMTVLLDNAFRYCPAHGHISFSLEKRPKGVELTVQNTAENIRQEELSHFTERFYRGSTAGSTQGSGLGLAIVQSVVRRHHGKLSVTAPSAKEIAIHIVL